VLKNPTINFNVHFNPLGTCTCSTPEVVLAFLLYEGSTIHTASDQFVSCVYFSLHTALFIHPHRQKSYLQAPTWNSCIFTPIENWTHVYLNLFTRNSPYYHLLKYLLFLQKHPVYKCQNEKKKVKLSLCLINHHWIKAYIYIYIYIYIYTHTSVNEYIPTFVTSGLCYFHRLAVRLVTVTSGKRAIDTKRIE